jgi:hypothetical protein
VGCATSSLADAIARAEKATMAKDVKVEVEHEHHSIQYDYLLAGWG